MKNKNGFISMTLVYTFLILFLFLMLSVLSAYAQKNKFLSGISDKIKTKVVVDNNYFPFGNVQYSKTFAYTGNYQLYNVPADGIYNISLWGAQGGVVPGSVTESGNYGYGAYVSGEIKLEKGDKLYFFVGGQGGIAPSVRTTGRASVGGYNGGGDAGYEASGAGGGGGATDVRINDTGLQGRIMVAGAGGGSANWSLPRYGGNAGGLQGYDGLKYQLLTSLTNSTGGTQTSGGRAGLGLGDEVYIAYNGDLGLGGNSSIVYGGGGGSGYNGGGGGSIHYSTVGSGAGGSSYISGHNGCVAITITSASKCASALNLECSVHYSNKIFTNTLMIDGSGYKWTTSKQARVLMPSKAGGNNASGVGNTGNGQATITYLRSE